MPFLRSTISLLAALFLPSLVLAADRIPIHAWASIPSDQTSVERYKELADCGFTTSFSGFTNAKATTAALDAARAAGIKLFISLPELSANPQATAKAFMTHPALAGYHLQDEPSAADFPRLAKWLSQIESVDKTHPCYINLFPTYATAEQLGCPTYKEHVERFTRQVGVPFISFDHYPIVGQKLRGDWYENLEIIRDASLKSEKPFWAFCLSVAHGPYPVPTLAHLRLQVFSDLAYGAQCIQYFTYWTPVDPHWNFHDAPIDPKGNRTDTYALVKQMNGEIQALAPVFLGCRVLAVSHTGRQPTGTTPYKPADPVISLQTEGAGAVVSLLAKSNQRYVAIVNRDFTAPMTLKITFDPAVSIRIVDKAGASTPIPKGLYAARIAPGDICLFNWDAR
jgi:hypothetical protein